MKQEMTGFWDAVASAGPYADSLHLLQTDNHTNTPSLTRLKTKLKDTVCFYCLLFCKKKLQFWQGRNCDECSLTVSNEPPSVVCSVDVVACCVNRKRRRVCRRVIHRTQSRCWDTNMTVSSSSHARSFLHDERSAVCAGLCQLVFQFPMMWCKLL